MSKFRRAVVTGGAGFLGSRVCRRLPVVVPREEGPAASWLREQREEEGSPDEEMTPAQEAGPPGSGGAPSWRGHAGQVEPDDAGQDQPDRDELDH